MFKWLFKKNPKPGEIWVDEEEPSTKIEILDLERGKVWYRHIQLAGTLINSHAEFQETKYFIKSLYKKES